MILYQKKSLFLLVVTTLLVLNFSLSSCKKTDTNMKCLSPDQVTNQISPDILYTSSIECLDENRPEDAFFLVEMAQAYTGFDQNRLTDPNRAYIIGSMIYKERTQKQERLYMKTYNRLKNDYDGGFSVLRSMCERAKRIGMPAYYPHYMMIPLPPPAKKNWISTASLDKVRVLSDAEVRLLYDTSYQLMWEGIKLEGIWGDEQKEMRWVKKTPLFCRDIESKVNVLKRMKQMR